MLLTATQSIRTMGTSRKLVTFHAHPGKEMVCNNCFTTATVPRGCPNGFVFFNVGTPKMSTTSGFGIGKNGACLIWTMWWCIWTIKGLNELQCLSSECLKPGVGIWPNVLNLGFSNTTAVRMMFHTNTTRVRKVSPRG